MNLVLNLISLLGIFGLCGIAWLGSENKKIIPWKIMGVGIGMQLFIGFLVFTVAPTSGLPPELPGMPAADLMTRQIWWWATVITTGAGIALLFTMSSLATKAAGVILIAVPHLIGAPHPVDTQSAVPAVLASEFAAASIATAAVFWVVLGVALGCVHLRMPHHAGDLPHRNPSTG